VSYSQWQGVYAYATSQGYAFDNPGSGKADNHPSGSDPGDRVVRGGSYAFVASSARCANRQIGSLTFAVIDVGFRCVRGR
jgi:formylglycine-generating enzyme required for sulfatase activity